MNLFKDISDLNKKTDKIKKPSKPPKPMNLQTLCKGFRLRVIENE